MFACVPLRGVGYGDKDLSMQPRPCGPFRICLFVSAVASDALKAPLLPHQGGSKINEALPKDRARRALKKADL